MTVLKTFAACSVFTAVFALPTSPSDINASLTLIDSPNTPPPAVCNVQEQDSKDVYGITVPVAFSEDTCSKAHEAVADIIVNSGNAWECKPYGAWTILFFATSENVADHVNDAMNKVFPKFVFHCANSEAAEVNPLDAGESPSALVKGDAVPAHEQSCVAENKGLFNFYWVRVGEAFDLGRCEEFGRLLDDNSPALWRYTCGPDGFGGVLAHFEDTINRAGYINETAHRVWPEVNGFNCPDH